MRHALCIALGLLYVTGGVAIAHGEPARLLRRLEAMRFRAGLEGLAARAEAALAVAEESSPLAAAARWGDAAQLAQACVERGAEALAIADGGWRPRAEVRSIFEIAAACELGVRTASAARAAAEAADVARREALRPLLAADRARIFAAHGEPDCACGAHLPRDVARAREWFYVRGPEGPLATYVTTTYVFSGNRQVGERVRRRHERP